jgi:hypothetical protein
MLLFIVLLAVGVEMLRRQTAREHPDASMDDVGRFGRSRAHSLRQTVAAGGRAVTERAGRLTGGSEAQSAGNVPPASTGDDAKLARLERLGQLRESGVLDDAEFKAEKAKVLAEAPG